MPGHLSSLRSLRGGAAHRETAQYLLDRHERHLASRPWSILIVLCVAQFMVILDMTVTAVALPNARPAPGTKVGPH